MCDINPPPALETLSVAAEGLFFPSETDAPLVPFFWPDETLRRLTPALVRELADIPADVVIKSTPLKKFFQPVIKQEEWHNDEERAEVQRFQALLECILSTLDKPKVFRVGETNMDVYIVGRVENGWAGLKTRIVET